MPNYPNTLTHANLWISAITSAFYSTMLLGAECTTQSPAHVQPLLELYTSEGCSSCPPADAWVSQLDGKSTSNAVSVLAWHVDYWDYIGWKDRFAQAKFSARQRDQASANFTGFVYTPQITLNGQDYRRWSNGDRFQSDVSTLAQQPAQANLQIWLNTSATQWQAHVKASTQKAAVLYVAVTENGLSSNVNAGENSGHTLRHDHVVRALYGPIAIHQGLADWQISLPIANDWKQKHLQMVAFVQAASSSEVLQSTQLAACL